MPLRGSIFSSDQAARRGRILTLALPIIGGMVSQNVLNVVDAYMVGGLGDAALSAVGMGGFVNWLSMAFILGLSSGVQAMSSRRLGEGALDKTAVPLNGGLLLAVLMAVPLSVVLIQLAGRVFALLVDDPEVVRQGVPYLEVRLVAMVAVACNFCFRGYWNGVNLSRIYMRTLIVMHTVNVVGNWLFINGNLGMPAMGVTGAALASAASVYVGTVMYGVQGFLYARAGGFLKGMPDRKTLLTMVRLAVPAGTQQFFFAGGMTAFFWIAGQVGTAELAASHVLVTLLLVAILPGMGFGLACASLVGQSLGAKDVDGAYRWGWDVVSLATACISLVAIPAALFPDVFLAGFLHNPDTLALARWPLRVAALTVLVDTTGMVLMNAQLGAGDSRRVMLVSVALQWFVFLPAAYAAGPGLGLGLMALWVCQGGHRVLQSGVFAAMWSGRRWAHAKV